MVQSLPESKALNTFVYLGSTQSDGLRAPDAHQGEAEVMKILLNQAPQEASEQLVPFMALQSSYWPHPPLDLTRAKEEQNLSPLLRSYL